MSGIFSILCDLGIVGTCVYFCFLIPTILRNADKCSIILLFTLALLMACSDFFESPVYFIIVLLMISKRKTETIENVC